jgi:hypothetical protein
MDVRVIRSRTLGEGWLGVSRAILREGRTAVWGPLPTIEAQRLTLVVEEPDPSDPRIAELGDPEWLAWMEANFGDPADVAELGGAKSYAVRLFDYDGRDQIAWVIERLRADPAARDATVTTFMPHTDTSYIPCVSLLDFWLPDGALELLVYAHSLDFGKKASTATSSSWRGSNTAWRQSWACGSAGSSSRSSRRTCTSRSVG